MFIKIKYNLDDTTIMRFDLFNKIINYDTVIYINCSNNQLSKLPKVPNSLQELLCDYNQLTTLPKLPNSLQIIDCNDNQLTSLPELPNSLMEFIFRHNKLIKKQKYKYLYKMIYL